MNPRKWTHGKRGCTHGWKVAVVNYPHFDRYCIQLCGSRRCAQNGANQRKVRHFERRFFEWYECYSSAGATDFSKAGNLENTAFWRFIKRIYTPFTPFEGGLPDEWWKHSVWCRVLFLWLGGGKLCIGNINLWIGQTKLWIDTWILWIGYKIRMSKNLFWGSRFVLKFLEIE